MKVSFIIPVYNVEQYLRQCVASILSQTYTDIEIILVDDGSSDTCPSLCDELALEDSRVFSFHKINGGLSDARNYGLAHASGDYVVFLDSDDYWLDSSSLRELVDIAELYPELDIIGFNCKYYYQDSKRYQNWAPFPVELNAPASNNDAISRLSEYGIFPVSACMKFIKRSFLINNSLFFIVGQLSEDIPWFISLMDKCNSCVFINSYIYAYRQSGDGSSITHSIGSKNVESIIDIIKTEVGALSKRSFNKEAKEAILSFLAYELSLLYACLQYLDNNIAERYYRELKQYNWLFSYTKNPKVRRVNLLRKLLGIKLTMLVMQLYLKAIR